MSRADSSGQDDGLREAVEALTADIASIHGPHVECGNSGCKKRGLSGMHCRDNEDCFEQAHEACALAGIGVRLTALLAEHPATPAEGADEDRETLWSLIGTEPTDLELKVFRKHNAARTANAKAAEERVQAERDDLQVAHGHRDHAIAT